jgi:hypothetical protein
VATAALAVVIAAAPAPAAASRLRAPKQRVRYGLSTNWAGYAATGSGPYTTVSASWTQPAVDCTETPRGYSDFWVGLDGDTSKTVEQIGTEANCIGGAASYAAWFEMFPKRPVIYANTVAPGDSLTASVTSVPKGRFQLTITDTTQGWSQTTTQKRRSAKRASGEVIAEAPATRKGVLPLADFAQASFAEATLDGAPLTEATPGIEPVTMVSGSTVKATPSGIGGGAFSVSWQHE